MKKLFTLAVVVEGDRVLLGRKVKKLGAGKWNAFGGKVESGETIEEAARRECEEEIGVSPTDMRKAGVLLMYYPDKPLGADVHEIHVFVVEDYTGEVVETSEMVEPKWFGLEQVPYGEMWEDDQYWLPPVLAGRRVEGEFRFDSEYVLRDHNVKVDKEERKAYV